MIPAMPLSEAKSRVEAAFHPLKVAFGNAHDGALLTFRVFAYDGSVLREGAIAAREYQDPTLLTNRLDIEHTAVSAAMGRSAA